MVIPEDDFLVNNDLVNNEESDLLKIMQRLVVVINEETKNLRAHNTSQLEIHSERKNRILLEFKRAQARFIGVGESATLIAQAKVLKKVIDKNQSAIKVQLSAVKEFASFLEVEARRNETDGTYSRMIGLSGSAR